MDIEEDGSNLYNSKMAIPDSVFNADTDVRSIPGLTEGKLPPRIKAVCEKYGSVFSKSLTADKHTKFKPESLPLIKRVPKNTALLEKDNGRNAGRPAERGHDREGD